MKTPLKIAIVLILVGLVAGAVALKNRENVGAASSPRPASPETAEARGGDAALTGSVTVSSQPLPKLIDLGADKCIPCKKMAPILEELKTEYSGRMEVVFIDVWKNPDAGKQYDIDLIPTQIFFDATGKELFRHQGFFGKEDILAKWKELGVKL